MKSVHWEPDLWALLDTTVFQIEIFNLKLSNLSNPKLGFTASDLQTLIRWAVQTFAFKGKYKSKGWILKLKLEE